MGLLLECGCWLQGFHVLWGSVIKEMTVLSGAPFPESHSRIPPIRIILWAPDCPAPCPRISYLYTVTPSHPSQQPPENAWGRQCPSFEIDPCSESTPQSYVFWIVDKPSAVSGPGCCLARGYSSGCSPVLSTGTRGPHLKDGRSAVTGRLCLQLLLSSSSPSVYPPPLILPTVLTSSVCASVCVSGCLCVCFLGLTIWMPRQKWPPLREE